MGLMDDFCFRMQSGSLSPSRFVLQKFRRLHRVVRSCAMRWKQRALAKPGEKQDVREAQPKKTVTFCLTATEVRTLSPCFSEEDEVEEHDDL